MIINNQFEIILENDFKEKWNNYCSIPLNISNSILNDKSFFESLKKVWKLSEFIYNNCLRYPSVLKDIYESGDLMRLYEKDYYSKQLSNLFLGIKNIAQINAIIRNFRRREMIRIAWRDLDGFSDFYQTISDISSFADACIDKLLTFLYDQQCEVNGIPRNENGEPQYLVVIGMGKLGGKELNFSSDIDLIFAYTGKGNEEFFNKLSQKLLKALSLSTNDGPLFRVDLRLRPFGESGPIAMSFDAMEDYYQEQGREWERYAMIKARIAAGNKSAGNELVTRLKPFIYRRYLDYNTFESLREMKQKISFEANSKRIKDNIKIGHGGIREIEFFVQTFQLIRGGLLPILQERSLIKSLKKLSDEGLISESLLNDLTCAYIFLRNVEHRLQEYSDQQTHTLPSEPIHKHRLAIAMGFTNWSMFLEELQKHTNVVNNHFNQLFRLNEINQDIFYNIWLNLQNSDAAKELLSSCGFIAPDEILKLLNDINLNYDSYKRLDKLMPLILSDIAKIKNQTQTLKRIIELIHAIGGRACYFSLLIENIHAISHLVKLASNSSWIISFLSRHPTLLDELLDHRTLYYPPTKSELKYELSHIIDQISPEDLEHQMDALRVFKQINILRVASADISNLLPLMKVSDYLTDIAETVLEKVLELSFDYLSRKYGNPICEINEKLFDNGFAFIAYGKLGGIELGYESDLDLIFLHSGTQNQFFPRLGQRILHLLTTRTSAGILYETDMRLRPNGNSGMLVTHTKAFEDYQFNHAWDWEHQALVKARAICGDINIIKQFNTMRASILSKHRDKVTLQTNIKEMRKRLRENMSYKNSETFDLKNGLGGIIDIEFLTQFLVLLNANFYSNIIQFTDVVRIIQSLLSVGIVNEITAYILRKAYLIYRSAMHRLSLQKQPALVSNENFLDLRENIKKIWNFYLNDSL